MAVSSRFALAAAVIGAAGCVAAAQESLVVFAFDQTLDALIRIDDLVAVINHWGPCP